jgi:hypothetical protein
VAFSDEKERKDWFKKARKIFKIFNQSDVARGLYTL